MKIKMILPMLLLLIFLCACGKEAKPEEQIGPEDYQGRKLITYDCVMVPVMETGYEITAVRLEIDKNGECEVYFTSAAFDEFEELQKYQGQILPFKRIRLTEEETEELLACIEENSLYDLDEDLSEEGCDGSYEYLTVYYNGERRVGGYMVVDKTFCCVADKIFELLGDEYYATYDEAEEQIEEAMREELSGDGASAEEDVLSEDSLSCIAQALDTEDNEKYAYQIADVLVKLEQPAGDIVEAELFKTDEDTDDSLLQVTDSQDRVYVIYLDRHYFVYAIKKDSKDGDFVYMVEK